MSKMEDSEGLKLNSSPVSHFSGDDNDHQPLQLRETPSSPSFMGRIKASTYALLPLGKRRALAHHHHHGCHHGATGAHFKVKRHYNTRSSVGGGAVGVGRLEPEMGLPKLSSASLRKSDKVLKLPQLVCDYMEKKDGGGGMIGGVLRRPARMSRRRRGSALAVPAGAGAASRSKKQEMEEVMSDMRVITRSMADLCGSEVSSIDDRAKMKRNVMGLNICIERLEQLTAATSSAQPPPRPGHYDRQPRRRTPKEAWCNANGAGTEQRIRGGVAKKQAALLSSSRQPDNCGDLLIEEDI